MKPMHSNYIISNEESWSIYKNKIAKFLALDILSRERIKYRGLIKTIPTSTNAVYSTDDYIVKIFKPEVCGCDPFCDFKREVYALELMKSTQIRTPRLIAGGLFECNHNFYYCITERIHIPPVSKFLYSCTPSDLLLLGEKLRNVLENFHAISIEKTKLSKSNESFSDGVFVHGDLSANNVLYDGNTLAIIDFEDWLYAPSYTELPVIVFEMINDYIDLAPLFLDIPYDELKRLLIAGINTHNESDKFIEKYNLYF